MHIVDVAHFDAKGDAAAVLEVEANESSSARELWNLGRKVLDFAPNVIQYA